MKRFACITLLLLAYGVVQAQTGTNALYEKSYRYVKTVANGTSAYSTGKIVGSCDSLDLSKLSSLGTWVFLQNIGMVDSMKNDASFEMWVFIGRPSSFAADGATLDLSWADAQKLVAVLPFGSSVYDNSHISFAYEPQINTMISVNGDSQTQRYLYYYLVIRSTKTWTVASTLVFKVTLFR